MHNNGAGSILLRLIFGEAEGDALIPRLVPHTLIIEVHFPSIIRRWHVEDFEFVGH
jgi:hypothetical protein